MSYKVVRDFTDLQDNNHVYRTGDPFPRSGVEVEQGRIEELSSNKNKRKQILIKKSSKPEKTEPVEIKEEQVEVETLEPPKEEKVEKKDNKKKKEK